MAFILNETYANIKQLLLILEIILFLIYFLLFTFILHLLLNCCFKDGDFIVFRNRDFNPS